MNLRAFVAAIGVAFAFPLSASSAFAQADPVVEVTKVVVTKYLSVMYDQKCKGQERDADDTMGNAFCSAAGALTDKKEEEFKEKVAKDLDEIKSHLNDIDKAIQTLDAKNDEIIKDLNKALVRLDELPAATKVGEEIIKIRTLFNDQFLRLLTPEGMAGPEARTRQSAFAREILDVSELHLSLGYLHDGLTHPLDRQTALIEQWFQESLVGVDLDKAGALQSFAYMKNLATQIRLVQIKGEMMYAFAAAIRARECKEKPDTCLQPAYSVDEFRDLMAGHYREQTDALYRVVVAIALHSNKLHGADPNFMIPNGDALLNGLIDYENMFSETPGGLRGLVIGLGDSFDGNLAVAVPDGSGTQKDVALTPVGKPIEIKAGMIDWWRRTEGQPVYDEVHFADTWKVYRYEDPSLPAGAFSIKTGLPWLASSGEIKIAADAVAPLGTFTALARAGGVYAMMQDAWPTKAATISSCELVVDSRRDSYCGGIAGSASQPAVYFDWSGAIYQVGTTPISMHGRFQIRLDRLRPITVAAGGKVKVNVVLGDIRPIMAAKKGVTLESDLNDASFTTYFWTDFTRPVLTSYTATSSLRAGIFLDDWNHGLVWSGDLTQPPMSKAAVSRHNGQETFSFDFAAGKPQTLSVAVDGHFTVPTSGIFATSNMDAAAGLNVQGIYLTVE